MSDQNYKVNQVVSAMNFGLILLGLTIGLMLNLRILNEQEADQRSEWSSVQVVAPTTPPVAGQASVDTALLLYHIRVPANAAHPRYNPKLLDRGLASRRAWSENIQVDVGPSAFSSWGILGSTLAHELEVHCLQNFALINLMDIFGLQGSKWAERQAYIYEIKNARRFALPPAQTQAIADTMRYYYNIDLGEASSSRMHLLRARLSNRVSRWFARSSLIPDK